MDSIPEVVCNKCGLSHPHTLEFFEANYGLGTLRKVCRQCRREQETRRYAADREKHAAIRRDLRHAREKRMQELPEAEWNLHTPKDPNYRTCRSCERTLPVEGNFVGMIGRLCAECKAVKTAERIAASPRSAPSRVCKQCGIKKENTFKIFRPKGSGLCRECENLAHKAYRLANPLVHRAKKHRRRARMKAAGGTYTPNDVAVKFKQQGGKCYWCGTSLDWESKSFDVDHLFPIAKLGENSPRNIVCACRICNKYKSDKMPWEFMNRLL